ncbi:MULTISPECIES: FtsX-like permease family protein [Streptomyces]|uniref:ABC transporter permease n=1 Tax=Streptomyces luteosporeus TaxID=173856 RepID=A0ABN3TWS0_9ACTN
MTFLRTYARDLAMGARFAVTGGRAGWLRTALTALGVGIGVALLLVLAALPEAVGAREERDRARHGARSEQLARPRPDTVLIKEADTEYRGRHVRGRLVRPEGPKAPVPPGVSALPRPGEMVVSPALKELLASPDGRLLRERLPHRLAGTIGAGGLVGPDELAYYAGDDRLAIRHHLPSDPHRITSFRGRFLMPPLGEDVPVLGGLACAVMLLPVAVLIATAARFGGERRDRRLAALRLVGADNRTTRRVAAGESLCGALFGLAAGTGLFLLLRQGGPWVRLNGVGVYPGDLVPSPLSAVVVAVAVPLLTVAVSLFALRDVAIEPLGVVRGAPRRRRLWWRVALPVLGLALLAGLSANVFDTLFLGYKWLVVPAAAVLILLGVSVLLPWVVQAVVGRLRGGPPAWQLATRRLQLDSGPASRTVAGILVAVAGAVAVQMFYSGIPTEEPAAAGSDRAATVRMMMDVASGPQVQSLVAKVRGAEGVREAAGFTTMLVDREDAVGVHELTVADCAGLRLLARVGECRDGDSFLVHQPPHSYGPVPQPGMKVVLPGAPDSRTHWTVPPAARVVEPEGEGVLQHWTTGILATPSAVPTAGVRDAGAKVIARLDPRVPDAVEHVRNAAAAASSEVNVFESRLASGTGESDYRSLLRLLPGGTALALGLVAVSLMLATVEQLRERRSALSVLAAFGASRSVIAWSVIWQTAVPVVLGMMLAVAFGLGLGRLVMTMTPLRVADWFGFVPIVGAGLGVITLVTLAALPALWRMMRPDGLRAE